MVDMEIPFKIGEPKYFQIYWGKKNHWMFNSNEEIGLTTQTIPKYDI